MYPSDTYTFSAPDPLLMAFWWRWSDGGVGRESPTDFCLCFSLSSIIYSSYLQSTHSPQET
jgi:hypothetical protein